MSSFYLSGNDFYHLERKLKRFIEAFFKAGGGEGDISRLEGSDLKGFELEQALSSSSLFSARRLVILRYPERAKAESLNRLIDRIVKPPPKITVFLVSRSSDRRLSWVKRIEKLPTERFDLPKKELWPSFYQKMASRDFGLKLSLDLAKEFSRRVSDNTLLAAQELEKIRSSGEENVRSETIDQLIARPAEEDIFSFLDELLSGEIARAFRRLKGGLLESFQPVFLISQFQRIVRWLFLLEAAEASKKPINDLARELKVKPFALQKTKSLLRRLNGRQLERLADRLFSIDVNLKSGRLPDDLLLSLVIFDIVNLLDSGRMEL